jgi:hypothetical protein
MSQKNKRRFGYQAAQSEYKKKLLNKKKNPIISHLSHQIVKNI